MWHPTHVQVTVQKASGLLIKGKNDTNDCFVVIALGKTKFRTSVKESTPSNVEWHEECELPIPDQGNTAEILLTALHRNFLGVDEFLGRVAIPLNSLDIYERPKNRWYTLQSKPGQESKAKDRGQLEVKVGFTVKSGSLMDLSKKEKHKSSIGSLSHMAQSVGGSLLSIASVEKRKGIKKFAKSLGSKVHLKSKKKDVDDDNSSFGSVNSLQHRSNFEPKFKSKQTFEDADPGVVSDDDEFTFDDLSHKSSGSSLNHSHQHLNPALTEPVENLSSTLHKSNTLPKLPKPEASPPVEDEWEQKLYRNKTKSNTLRSGSADNLNVRSSWESPKLSSRIDEEDSVEVKKEEKKKVIINTTPEPVVKHEKESFSTKFKNFRKGKSEHTDSKTEKNTNQYSDRIIIGGENEHPHHGSTNNKISNELLRKFEGKTREDLILKVCDMEHELEHSKKKLKDLEDYLDELLLRVMETTPRILQNPYSSCKLAHKNYSS